MIRKNTLPSKSRQKGASLIEYALVLATVVAIGIYLFGSGAKDDAGVIGDAIKSRADTAVSNLTGK